MIKILKHIYFVVILQRFTTELPVFYNLMKFMLPLLCARLCTEYFTNINSLNLGNNPILIIILILQVRKWGTDWLSNLPKVN